MAKKLSRAQRKKQLEKQKNYLVKQGKISKKSNVSQAEINRQISTIKAQEQVKKKNKNKSKEKYKKSLELQSWKFHQLVSMGFKPEQLKSTYLRKIKKKDILNDNVTRENYPFLFDSFGFDFNKRYYFPDGKGWLVMFLDYTGENTLEELMYRFQRYSPETLITFLEGILSTPRIHDNSKKDSGSNGRAGEFRSHVFTDSVAKTVVNSLNSDLDVNLEKKRYHNKTNRYWQHLSENGSYVVHSITPYECLVILNALMYNVTEQAWDYYEGTYNALTNYFPDFKTFLPSP